MLGIKIPVFKKFNELVWNTYLHYDTRNHWFSILKSYLEIWKKKLFNVKTSRILSDKYKLMHAVLVLTFWSSTKGVMHEHWTFKVCIQFFGRWASKNGSPGCVSIYPGPECQYGGVCGMCKGVWRETRHGARSSRYQWLCYKGVSIFFAVWIDVMLFNKSSKDDCIDGNMDQLIIHKV